MIKDADGNMLYRRDDIIMLDLLKEDRRRRLGKVSGEILIVKRHPEKHLLRAANAYGFCYELLATAKVLKVIRILIIGSKDFYHITIKDVLEHGSFLFFKTQGFEKQIFITLEQLEQYGVKN